MRYDPEHKQKTRERVVAEAAKAIRAEGPHRVGVAEVMSRAGLTHGGFYAHFPSKDALIVEAIGAMFEQMAKRVARETEGKSPAEGLAAYVDFYLSPEHRDRRDAGCPLPTLAADLPRLTPEARERYGRGVAGLTGLIAERLQAFGRDDAEALASSMVAELVGALSLARAVADPVQSDQILARSRASLKHRIGLEPRL